MYKLKESLNVLKEEKSEKEIFVEYLTKEYNLFPISGNIYGVKAKDLFAKFSPIPKDAFTTLPETFEFKIDENLWTFENTAFYYWDIPQEEFFKNSIVTEKQFDELKDINSTVESGHDFENFVHESKYNDICRFFPDVRGAFSFRVRSDKYDLTADIERRGTWINFNWDEEGIPHTLKTDKFDGIIKFFGETLTCKTFDIMSSVLLSYKKTLDNTPVINVSKLDKDVDFEQDVNFHEPELLPEKLKQEFNQYLLDNFEEELKIDNIEEIVRKMREEKLSKKAFSLDNYTALLYVYFKDELNIDILKYIKDNELALWTAQTLGFFRYVSKDNTLTIYRKWFKDGQQLSLQASRFKYYVIEDGIEDVSRIDWPKFINFIIKLPSSVREASLNNYLGHFNMNHTYIEFEPVTNSLGEEVSNFKVLSEILDKYNDHFKAVKR